MLKPLFGIEALSWVCILGAAPFAAMGFITYSAALFNKQKSVSIKRRHPNDCYKRTAFIVTLDFDNIPNGGTNVVLEKVKALGCCYCVYSTRKHTTHAPRLRIVLPSDRVMTPDEFLRRA